MRRLPLLSSENLSEAGRCAKFLVQESVGRGLLEGGMQSRRVLEPAVATVSDGESRKSESRTAGARESDKSANNFSEYTHLHFFQECSF